MKLEAPIVDYIQNVVRVCKVIGIESVIIEQGMVRGIHADRTVALIEDTNVPTFPFQALGLTRLPDLESRLALARLQEGFNVEAYIKANSTAVFSLTLKAKGTKIDYRCADPVRIEAKRKINDVMKYRIKLSDKVITMLSKGISAMSAEKATLIANSEGVSFELVDVANDVFKYTFPEPAEVLTDETTAEFAHRYPVKLLLSVFKENPNGTFEIGGTGCLKIAVGKLSVYLVPLAG